MSGKLQTQFHKTLNNKNKNGYTEKCDRCPKKGIPPCCEKLTLKQNLFDVHISTAKAESTTTLVHFPVFNRY